MCRAEIIANRSVQEEMVEALESNIPGILYTLIPDVQGRGKNDRKLGTATWPELNFCLFAFVEEREATEIRRVIADIKQRFPNEGIKLFILRSSE